MANLVWRVEDWFYALDRVNATLLGVGVGLVLMSPALIGLEVAAVAIAFIAYFPWHAWLTISLFLVQFSSYERKRLLRRNANGIEGFFRRIFSSYCLFCLGWFYTVMGGAWLLGVAE